MSKEILDKNALHVHSWNEVPYGYTGVVHYIDGYIHVFDGYIHRIDGPAMILKSGENYWYLYDTHYVTAEEHFNELFKISAKDVQEWMLFNLDLWRAYETY